MPHSEEVIFGHATMLPAARRSEYLTKECAGDEGLRRRVEQLLVAHECDDSFLDLVDKQQEIGHGLSITEGHDLGPYRILKEIGEGGFGVVYLAEQQRPIKRNVAIKIIKPGMNSRAVITRFESERQALALMDHPNIASVFDGGSSDEGQRPYFVMELVQGVPITNYCDSHSLPIRERLELIISVCNAVHHAHQKGIIHRDIKPSNVMVTEHDGKPVVKVIDFGVAKALHQRLAGQSHQTQQGVLIGTPQYMSPEQAELGRLDVDTRSDVYSLAVLLYELIVGSTPLDVEKLRAASFQETQRMIREEQPLRPSRKLSIAGVDLSKLAKQRSVLPEKLTRVIEGDLDWIVLKGLEKERSRRYESARHLADDIHRSLSHQPVLAGPPSFTYRTSKFVIRNRVGLIFAATTACALAAVVWGLANHRQHRIAAVKKDQVRLNNAVDEANAALVAAVEAQDSNELWTAAKLMGSQIETLVNETPVENTTASRAKTFLIRLANANQDRDFTFSMEQLLVQHSTRQSDESLRTMEKGFRQILKNRGYDVQVISPDELASRLKKDHAPIKLTDALELWLWTRMKLSETGGEEITADEIEDWTNAMNKADPNPIRTAIRSAIFCTVQADGAMLDRAVECGDLSAMCARKLSWLSQAYLQVGEPKRSKEIRNYALARYSNDLILNFEHATRLMNLMRTDEAIRYFMRCTSIRPRNSEVWKNLAEALGRNSEFTQAQMAIEKAIVLEPNDSESHLQLCELLSRNKQPKKAIVAGERTLSLDENQFMAWRWIGRANMDLKQYSQALDAFEKFRKRAGANEKLLVEDWMIDCQEKLDLGQ